jgi:hypothetical protein
MKPTTIAAAKYKQEKKRFATITAYDYSFAKLFADEGINVMLVGDSLGMTVQGHDSTLPVTVEDIAYHTRAVRRGALGLSPAFRSPFMTYATPEQAFENAAVVMRAGANMVKIEGGAWLVDTVKMLTERAVPVCGHLGLTPQSVNVFGGYKIQGRGDAGQVLLDDAGHYKPLALSCWCWSACRLSWRSASLKHCLFRLSVLAQVTSQTGKFSSCTMRLALPVVISRNLRRISSMKQRYARRSAAVYD